MAPKQKLIIDTDPGQDDAVAMLLAFASPELDVLGITTVAGNVPLALTQEMHARSATLPAVPKCPSSPAQTGHWREAS